MQELAAKHLHAPPPLLPTSGPLERLAFRLLEKDPARRPPSAEAVIEGLDGYQLFRKQLRVGYHFPRRGRREAARGVLSRATSGSVGKKALSRISANDHGHSAGR